MFKCVWDELSHMWMLVDNTGNSVMFSASERYVVERMLELNGDQQNW